VSIYPHIIARTMEKEDGSKYAYLTISRATKEGKEIATEWVRRFKEYEQPCLRYEFSWYGKGIYGNLDFHQVDEETILAFLPQNKKHIAEKLISTGDWKMAKLKVLEG